MLIPFYRYMRQMTSLEKLSEDFFTQDRCLAVDIPRLEMCDFPEKSPDLSRMRFEIADSHSQICGIS